MNMCTIVGRLCKNPEVRETETGKKVTNVTVAVSRSYKNADGEYDVDYIDCVLWNNIAENTAEFCKKGDIVGIKGRIETKFFDKDESKQKETIIVADKITFLSTKKEHEKTEDQEMDI